MCLSPCRAFDVYQPGTPDPFFPSIEHWGTRYARGFAPPSVTYGDNPLLEMARRGATGPSQELDHLMMTSHTQLNALICERDAIWGELNALRRSRSGLLKALMKAILQRFRK